MWGRKERGRAVPALGLTGHGPACLSCTHRNQHCAVSGNAVALMVCRCYPEIKDHFKTALSKIGICSPLGALRLEIPIFFHNPCTHPSLLSECTLYPHPSSSSVGHLTPAIPFWGSGEIYYSSSSRTAWRTWEVEIASLVWVPVLVRGWWNVGQRGTGLLNWQCCSPCDPGGPLGPWLSKGRKSQPPAAPSKSGVPEMRTKSTACSPQHRPNRNPRSFLLILTPLYFIW